MQLDPLSPNTLELAQGLLRKPLESGELGVLLADAGVGKTACLTQIALGYLLRGVPVLHVCIDEVPDKIKAWYREFLKSIASEQATDEDLSSLQRRIEPLRFILAYLNQTFNPDKLELSFQNLEEQAKFCPSMVVLDGLDFDQTPREIIEALQGFAKNHKVAVWMSAQTHRHIPTINEMGIPYPCHLIDDLFDAIVLLKAIPNAIKVNVLKHGTQYMPGYPEIFINPQTFATIKDTAATSE